MHIRRSLPLAAALTATVWALVATRSGPAPGQMRLSPCHLDRLGEQVLCGVVDVYEDRDAAEGARIPIHVAVLPPLRRAAAEDPLFVFAGGPGQGARGYAAAVARAFRPIRRSRAIVLVDLRGTGQSAPLRCAAGVDPAETLVVGAGDLLADGFECVRSLAGNPRHYTHQNALADLEEVRQRLGYRQINLWGGSWGTRAALLYAARYPHAVRRVVLDGAASLDMHFPVAVSRDAQRAFEALAARCSDDPMCSRAFPDSAQTLADLLRSLEAVPRVAQIAHPRTGMPVRIALTSDKVAEIVRVALYTPGDAARVLALIQRASEGDVAPLVAQHVHSAESSTEDMALGTTLAILCSEDLPRVTLAEVAAGAGGSFFGTGYATAWLARCNGWPTGPPLDAHEPIVLDPPALILSGESDPITPPSAGGLMARHFRHSLQVVVPGASHNTSFTGCVPDVMARFLDGVDIEASCVRDTPLPLPIIAAGGRP